MTPPDWISMGDELRVELDALELEVRAWVFMCWPNWWELEFWRDCREAVLLLPPKQRDPLTSKASERGSPLFDNGHEFYETALEKLRAHGRANDWPNPPWWPEEDERG